MTLSQSGLDYICQNFGLQSCCVESGISWNYMAGGQDHPENGGTAQIVARLASGLLDSLIITNPGGEHSQKQSLMLQTGVL